MKTNWINPNIPNTGYVKFTKFEKLIFDTKIAVTHIIKAKILYVFLLSLQFCKNPYPDAIIVVKIASSITKPYIFL